MKIYTYERQAQSTVCFTFAEIEVAIQLCNKSVNFRAVFVQTSFLLKWFLSRYIRKEISGRFSLRI